MGNMNQPFLPQNTAPFRPQGKCRHRPAAAAAVTRDFLYSLVFFFFFWCGSVPQVGVPPENHFGQVDVNDLLSKLISNGIIKPSQPEAVVPVGIGQSVHLFKAIPNFSIHVISLMETNCEHPTEPTAAAPAAAPAVEEEEEEDQEEEEEDVPDLTNFTLDELKQ